VTKSSCEQVEFGEEETQYYPSAKTVDVLERIVLSGAKGWVGGYKHCPENSDDGEGAHYD